MTGTIGVRSRSTTDAAARGNGAEARRSGSGFRPTPRRRNRIAAGVALGATAIAGNLLVYSSLDDREPVVQVVRDVPAGEQLRADMLRTVDGDLDGSVNVVAGDQLESLIGQYARVRLVSGGLVTAESVQPAPLVDPGNAVVAVRVPDGALPVGLRERVAVLLVLPAVDADAQPVTVTGVVVALPSQPDAVLGTLSLSVELAADDAAVVAAADDVRVVLLDPSTGGDGD